MSKGKKGEIEIGRNFLPWWLLTTTMCASQLVSPFGVVSLFQLFGEAVLGLSQGSVSELLCKPKPWHMLSIKGREPFIRMQLWLADASNNIEKLQTLKSERDSNSSKLRTVNKRPIEDLGEVSPGSPSDDPESPGGGSAKKQRVLFSVKQKEALKVAFSLDPYPSPSAMEFLAQELGLEHRTISNWFHNHRMRLKQSHPHEIESLLPPPPKNDGETRPFDPLHFRILVNQRLLELAQSASPPESPTGLDLSSKSRDSSSGGDGGDGAKPQRSGRRKPVAPQWVNPAAASSNDWAVTGEDQDKNATKDDDITSPGEVPKKDDDETGEEVMMEEQPQVGQEGED